MEMAWSAGVRCMTPLDLKFATLDASEGCIKVPPASSQTTGFRQEVATFST